MRVRKMYKTLVACLLVGIISAGQIKAQDKFDMPPKWAGYPIVIASHESEFDYLSVNKGKELKEERVERFTVIVNSDKADAAYNSIYFPVNFKANITKVSSSGSKSYDETDASNFLDVNAIPNLYRSMFSGYESFDYINFGKLKKGDKIEVELSQTIEKSSNDHFGGTDCGAFRHHVLTFPKEMPSGSHLITIRASKGMYLNYESMNRGPSIEIDSRLEADTTVYVIKAGQEDPVAIEYFSFPARNLATCKFEVAFCEKYDAENATLILGEADDTNSEYDESQVKAVTFNNLEIWKSTYSKQAKAFMVFMGTPRGKSTSDWIKHVYRRMQAYAYNTGMVDNYSNEMFMGIIATILDESIYKYDVIVGPDRRTSSINDMTLNGEWRYGFVINDKKEDAYLFPANRYSSWNQNDMYLIEEDAYLFTPADKLENCLIETMAITETLPADNQHVIRSKVKLGGDDEGGFSNIIVSKSTNLSGGFKEKAGNMTISVPEYHKALLGKAEFGKYAHLRSSTDASKFEDGRMKIYEAKARKLVDSVNYQRIDIKQAGFEEENDWLQISEKYILPGDDLIKLSLKDSMSLYEIQLGKFIETPYPIETKDFQRNGDVQADHPFIVDFKIRLEVPKGYAVFGYDKFDGTTETEFATLKSKAELKGKDLEVKVSLVLKKANLEKSEWQQLVTMLKKMQELDKVKITMAGN